MERLREKQGISKRSKILGGGTTVVELQTQNYSSGPDAEGQTSSHGLTPLSTFLAFVCLLEFSGSTAVEVNKVSGNFSMCFRWQMTFNSISSWFNIWLFEIPSVRCFISVFFFCLCLSVCPVRACNFKTEWVHYNSGTKATSFASDTNRVGLLCDDWEGVSKKKFPDFRRLKWIHPACLFIYF